MAAITLKSPSSSFSGTRSKDVADSSLVQDVIAEEESCPAASIAGNFDIYSTYQRILRDDQIATPLAAILALTELIEKSTAGTMFELVKALEDGAEELKKRTPNPISLNAGCELFIAFVTLFPHESDSFAELKTELVKQGQKYAADALRYRDRIADLVLGFIKDDSVILTHSYSRVVMKALLNAHKHKRISVYVTESRPRGLGIMTYEKLTNAGIPCTIVLDSAVAYVMDKVDFVLVGSEAVVESGGLINSVGSNQMAIIAKSANKPFYALAESYKFHRLFPLSQYDLPTHNPQTLSFLRPPQRPGPVLTARPSVAPMGSSRTTSSLTGLVHPTLASSAGRSSTSASSVQLTMTPDQIALNPDVDYTRPYLISLVFSDVGILTPEGVSQYLVGMFAG
ncbi:nagb/rpia/CoA transferase-like protein [Punctularia strigosozonata HHB-11173 SS5]|uniref:nagb/rpia/CoA transferase-like protein n=1 Tax=Punctularia strigosozonata (strain HHB-11173) TaxID=741275 RepID=UPI0004418638|nr:nagb/rpia/CoA transferase-like protein [Punctularia strigosozonata HHB-11173 SS5]EIN07411.1 nagb/rpia/CoA transferase-like protein [Punctularia strigosozonata HHB-11173 SS5]